MNKIFEGTISVHNNGNVLCAIDTETTGLTPGKHDCIEIAVIPLNGDYTPCRSVMPFHTLVQPRYFQNDPKALEVNQNLLVQACAHGMDSFDVGDRLEQWFTDLRLAEGKKLVPLGHNYISHDKPFITDLIGKLTYDYIFHWHPRDTMTIALGFNDLADFRCREVPFAKLSQGFICSKLGIENPKAHSAMEDALTCARMYKEMLKHHI